jgi:hypothetical protein
MRNEAANEGASRAMNVGTPTVFTDEYMAASRRCVPPMLSRRCAGCQAVFSMGVDGHGELPVSGDMAPLTPSPRTMT